MSRIPYEYLTTEVDRIITEMAYAKDSGMVNYYWAMYLFYLKEAGWTHQEFESATLQAVDDAWSSFYN